MAKQIRVHNQGKREIDYPPKNKGGKPRFLLPGRAVEMDEAMAKKYLGLYPKDLIMYDSLISGEKKDLNKENGRLESLNKTLTEENGQLKQDKQDLNEKIGLLEKELEEATKPEETESEKNNAGKKETDKAKE